MLSAFANVSVGKAVLTLLLIMCFIREMVGNLIRFPSEVTDAKLGERISLRCITNSNLADIEWYHQKIGSTIDRTVYLEGSMYTGYKERFRVSCNERKQQECVLTISNVNSSDAGKYTCKHNEVAASVELIVFEVYPSDRSCDFSNKFSMPIIGENPCNISAAVVSIYCQMKYYGNKVPEMLWTADQKEITLNLTISKNETNDRPIINSTVQLTAISTTKITCTIHFLAPDIISNIWWTKGVEVIALSNSSTKNETGCSSDDQNCQTAESCHQPQWMLPNGTLINRSKTLVLKDLASGVYECTNVCDIRRQNCTILQHTVNHSCNINSASETGISPAAIAIACIIPTAVAVAVVVAAFFYTRTRRRKKSNKRRQTDEISNTENNVESAENAETPLQDNHLQTPGDD